MAYNYSTILPIERDFDPISAAKWMQDNWVHSVTLSVLYIVGIFGGQWAMSHRPEFKMRRALIGWNLALAVFSILGFVRFLPHFWSVLRNHGFQYSICVSSYYDGVPGYWTLLFTLSKAFEMGDTVFIVLRKRPLIFLHYYHHVTVLVYCWQGYSEHAASGRWFLMMNYFVHSLMYSYYAIRAWGVRTPKILSMAVTLLQLFQMVMGLIVVLQVYRIKLAGQHCQQTFGNLYFALLIYFSYFLLFARFFYSAYLSKSHHKYQQYNRDGKIKKAEEKTSDDKNKIANGDSMHLKNGFTAYPRQRKI